MSSRAGRLARAAAGIALIIVGLAALGGTAGVIIALIGLVPLSAGVFNFCLLGPLFGVGLRGRSAPRAR
ncbi:MAG: YgaP-like transmembrane domain [Solirubrobacteraceae bacterium]